MHIPPILSRPYDISPLPAQLRHVPSCVHQPHVLFSGNRAQNLRTYLPKNLSPSDVEFIKATLQLSEGLRRDMARLHYQVFAARLKRKLASTRLLKRYEPLYAPATLQRLRKLHETHPDNLLLRRLYTDSLRDSLERHTTKQRDAIQNLHHRIDTSSFIDLVLKSRPALVTQFVTFLNRASHHVQTLGFANLKTFYQVANHHDYDALLAKTKEVIQKTDPTYWASYQRFKRSYEFRRHEEDTRTVTPDTIATSWLYRNWFIGKPSPGLHSGDWLRKTMQTMNTLGIPFTQQAQTVKFETPEDFTQFLNSPRKAKRIFMDLTSRSTKAPRAFVTIGQGGKEVWLSTAGRSGWDEGRCQLHEAGHANHYANVDKKLPSPLAASGNNAVTEAYAFLFEKLFSNPHWLTRVMGVEKSDAILFSQLVTFQHMTQLRRNRCKLSFELSLYDGTPIDNKPQRFYNDLFDTLHISTYERSRWAEIIDPDLYVADYVLGQLLSEQLESYLAKTFGTPKHRGDDWFKNPDAGTFLISLWKQGNLPPEEFSRQLGFKSPLDTEPYLQKVCKRLNYHLLEH